MTPVSQFRAHHQWLRTASADTVGVCEKSLFCVIAPSTTFRSGSFRGPRRAHSASLAGQGQPRTLGVRSGWLQVGKRAVGSGDKYFSTPMEWSYPRHYIIFQDSFLLSLKHTLGNRDNFQQLILCCKFPPNLQVVGAEASEMEGKVPTQI